MSSKPPKVDYRRNPPGMLRHLGKIDLLKTLARKFGADGRRLFERFATTVAIGSQAPDFTLTAVSGERVSLAEYRGKKHVVLEHIDRVLAELTR